MTTEKAISGERVIIYEARCPKCKRFCKVARIIYAVRMGEIEAFVRAEGSCKRCGDIEPDCLFYWPGEFD